MTDTSTINSLGGYPLGAANDPRAPYNEKPKEKVEVSVEAEAADDAVETALIVSAVPTNLLNKTSKPVSSNTYCLYIFLF